MSDSESVTENKPTTRRRFDAAFKLAAVNRVNAGEALKTVAADIQVNPTLLSRWKSELRSGDEGREPAAKARRGRVAGRARKAPAVGDGAEIKQALRAELRSLEQEARDIDRKIEQIKATLALY